MTLKIAIILGSTRPGRIGEAVAQWVLESARERGDAEYELVDLADHHLPDMDEPIPPAARRYSHPHTIAWAEVVGRYDGFVIVTPEYNRSFPGSVKNALDRVWAEWNDKAMGFVSYGFDGGVRAVEALRVVAGSLRLAAVGPQVALSSVADWDGFHGPFTPRPQSAKALTTTLDAVVSWSGALRGLRKSDRPDG